MVGRIIDTCLSRRKASKMQYGSVVMGGEICRREAASRRLSEVACGLRRMGGDAGRCTI